MSFPLIKEIWNFDLVSSNDMSLILPITEISAGSQKLSLSFNHQGSYGVTTPIDSNLASKVAAWKTGVKANVEWLDEGNVSLGRRVMWSGPVVDVNDDVTNDTSTISVMGWGEELEHRYLEQKLTYPSQAGGLIAFDLLAKGNAKTDTAGTARPTHITPGSRTDTQVRAIAYEVGQGIGAAIKALSDLENGFDYNISPIDRQLGISAPTEFTTRDKVQFGYRQVPNNLAAVARQQDGKRASNKFFAQGPPGLAIQDDIDSINELGIMLEGWASLSDVTDINILSAYSGSQLAFSSFPVSTITAKPMVPSASIWLPRLGLHYDLGDVVFLSVSRGRLQLSKQPARVFGQSYSFTPEGDPIVDSMEFNYS